MEWLPSTEDVKLALVYILRVSFLDAVVWGAIMAYFQSLPDRADFYAARWDNTAFLIARVWQVLLAVVVGVWFYLYFPGWEVFGAFVVIWLLYGEDIFFFWWMPLLRFFHLGLFWVAMRREDVLPRTLSDDELFGARVPIPSWYFPPHTSGWIYWVTGFKYAPSRGIIALLFALAIIGVSAYSPIVFIDAFVDFWRVW